jgi:preprotein translocase subunit SecA
MPIESGMLSKSIENAQKKVEGRNFDQRKHTLQYDDVMNKQRTVIYDERRRLLKGADMREQIERFLNSAVDRAIDSCTSGAGRDQMIDYDELLIELMKTFPLGHLTVEELEGKAVDQLKDEFRQRVQRLYERKEEEIGRVVILSQRPQATDEELAEHARAAGAPHLREIERVITLRSIDENWIDHLNLLDHLRSGVALRGYGQQDPVIVYAQEAFAEFETLKQQIEQDVVRKIFLVRIQEPERQLQQQQQERSAYNIRGMSRPEEPGQRTDETGKRVSEQRFTPKLGRNSKCYCGSGKKYKQCHLPLDNGNPPDNWPELYERAYGAVPAEVS